MSSTKKNVIALLTSALVAVVVLIAVEGIARVVLRLSFGIWPKTSLEAFYDLGTIRFISKPHHYLNVAPRESSEAVVFGFVPGEGGKVTTTSSHVVMNSLGYRSPERPLVAPEGTLRVVCSGGSTTLDIFAEENDETWPSLLEGELQTLLPEGEHQPRPHPVEVWNAGMAAYSSLENTISLLIRDIDLKPDVLLLYQGINDLRPASSQPFDRQCNTGQGPALRDMLGINLTPPPWYERIIIVELIRNLLLGPRDLISEKLLKKTGETLTSIPDEALDFFERNIRSYVAIGRSRGAAVILATQSITLRDGIEEGDLGYIDLMFPDLEGNAIIGELGRLNEVIRRVAGEENVTLIDVEKDIHLEKKHLADPMHFNKEGSTFFARTIAPVVASKLSEHMAERAREALPESAFVARPARK